MSMSINLEELKKKMNLVNFQNSSDKNNQKKDDPRFWTLKKDKNGNGAAIFRFLPSKDLNEHPFVTRYRYNFEGPSGLFYNEFSLTTIGQNDPVYQKNGEDYNSPDPEVKKATSKRKLISQHIANILVVSDPENPENEGKVFLYTFPNTIWKLIHDAMNPEKDPLNRVVAFNPFCPWTGAALELRTFTNSANFLDYSKSKFLTQSPIAGGNDAAIKDLISGSYPLASEFLNPSNFKSYDALKSKLDRVLAVKSPKVPTAPTLETVPPEVEDDLDEAFLNNLKSDDI